MALNELQVIDQCPTSSPSVIFVVSSYAKGKQRNNARAITCCCSLACRCRHLRPGWHTLHEFGHFAVAAVSGFPDAKLSFASVSYRDSERFWQTLAGGERPAAEAIYPLQRAGLLAAAGPAITALLIVCSVLILSTRKVTDAVAAFLAGLASWPE